MRDRCGLDDASMAKVRRSMGQEEAQQSNFQQQVQVLSGKIKIRNTISRVYEPTPAMDAYFAGEGRTAQNVIDAARKAYPQQLDTAAASIVKGEPAKDYHQELARLRSERQAYYKKHFVDD